MNFSIYCERYISRLYVTADALRLPAMIRARTLLPDLEPVVVSSVDDVPSGHRNLRTLFVTGFRGHPFTPCPGTRLHRCCNYHTVDLYAGCPLGCSYCIMQSYLANSPVTVYADPEPAIAAIRERAIAEPDRILRVGTGETGDSLLYDPLFGVTGQYIAAFSDLPNVHFESKTKTDFVDHLLDLPEKGNAVIGFSVNAAAAAVEEGESVSLQRRLAAATRAAAAGYRVAFHFDPMFRPEAAADGYTDVARRIGEAVSAEAVAWISLGTVRYTPALKQHLNRPYINDEFVGCADGKFRYIQRERVELYRSVVAALSVALRPLPAVYLCMESDAVWRRVFGDSPQSIPALSAIFEGAFVRGEDTT